MKCNSVIVVMLIFAITLQSCTSQKPVATQSRAQTFTELNAEQLKPFGRFALSNGKLEMVSTAMHFGFTFEGNECLINAEVQPGTHNYLQYEIDGKYIGRIRVDANNNSPIFIRTVGNGKHTLWMYKATEAHSGPIYITKVSGKNIVALERSSAPLIEFIGNSITCGAAADPSEVPCGTGQYHDQHNAYMSYGPVAARAVHANYIVSSVSGIGVYRNWNSDGPAMPEVFRSVDFQVNGRPWNFDFYRPDIVTIALGTNDFSKGDGVRQRLPFDSARYVHSYIDFVQSLQSYYPQAQIVLMNSPMVGGADAALMKNCLAAIKSEVDKKTVHLKPLKIFLFNPMKARGCSGHPNVEDHVILAKELMPYLRSLIDEIHVKK